MARLIRSANKNDRTHVTLALSFEQAIHMSSLSICDLPHLGKRGLKPICKLLYLHVLETRKFMRKYRTFSNVCLTKGSSVVIIHGHRNTNQHMTVLLVCIVFLLMYSTACSVSEPLFESSLAKCFNSVPSNLEK